MSSKANDVNRLGEQSINRLMFKLALPSVIAQVINILYNLVDRIYVGHMPRGGDLALTALGVVAPLILVISAFSVLVAGGGAPLAAIELGKGKRVEAEKYLGACFALLLLLAGGLTVLGLSLRQPLLLLFGASPETLPFATAYTSIYLLGTFFVLIALGLNAFISCQGQARIAMSSVVIGAVLNIILDPIFIFALDLGVRGAAYATIIAQAASAAFVLSFLCSSHSHLRLKWAHIRLDWQRLRAVLALGISTFIMQATESAVIMVFNRGLLYYGGNLYVGAMTIMLSVLQMLIVPVSGLTQGVMPLVSYNVGAQKPERVLAVVRRTLLISTTYSLLYYLLVWLNPGAFAALFTSKLELIELVQKLLPIYMFGLSCFGIQMTAQMYFVGSNQVRKSLLLALLRKVILLIPLALILPRFFGAVGIVWAEPLADASSITLAAVLLARAISQLKTTPPLPAKNV